MDEDSIINYLTVHMMHAEYIVMGMKLGLSLCGSDC